MSERFKKSGWYHEPVTNLYYKFVGIAKANPRYYILEGSYLFDVYKFRDSGELSKINHKHFMHTAPILSYLVEIGLKKPNLPPSVSEAKNTKTQQMTVKFTVQKKELSTALSIVKKAIGKNPVLPILEDVLFFVKDGSPHVAATDLEMSVCYRLDTALVDGGVTYNEKGDKLQYLACLDAIVLENLLKGGSPNDVFTFSLDYSDVKDIKANVTFSNGKSQLFAENPTHFPGMPFVTIETPSDFHFSLSQASVRQFVKKIAYLSTDQLRPAMTGGYCDNNNPEIRCSATDAHKLLAHRMPITKGSLPEGVTFIAPKKFLTTIKAVDTELQFGGSVVKNKLETLIAENDKTLVVARAIDARFPDYIQVVPLNNPYTLAIDKKQTIPIINRALAAANKTTKAVVFHLSDKVVSISAKDESSGTSYDSQIPNASYAGEEMMLGFNGKFLLGVLESFDGATVYVDLATPNRAAIFYDVSPKEKHPLMLEAAEYRKEALFWEMLLEIEAKGTKIQNVKSAITKRESEANTKSNQNRDWIWNQPFYKQFALLMPVSLSN